MPSSGGGMLEFVHARFRDLQKSMVDVKVLEKLGLTEDLFKMQFSRFRSRYLATDEHGENSRLDSLYKIYEERGRERAVQELKFDFYGFVVGQRFTRADIANQRALADLRYPAEWFPATRAKNRTIHLHIGPTNSGKTYHALKRLEEAETGIYAGPLRLLAHEVFVRMQAKGKRCALVTGDERKFSDENWAEYPPLISATVEMAPLNKPVDVAVLDEIQMIGDPFRGWAWTEAFLGVVASEVHVCGEARTEGIIRELCAAMGEELVVHRYERLSPLEMMDQSLNGDLSKLQKGDCVISFSVMGIHALKREIEKSTGKNVAVIYGSLPPETRSQQARLFNDPNNDYDILVASDAVGMGLNLSIKRVIFESSQKQDGFSFKSLQISEVKQIGGRAGRYRTTYQVLQAPTQGDAGAGAASSQPNAPGTDGPEDLFVDTGPPKDAQSSNAATAPSSSSRSLGLVTTLEKYDFPYIRLAMDADPPPIQTAGLQPPPHIIERFASYFPPNTPFSYVLLRLNSLCQMHSRFHLCTLKDHLTVAETIESVEGLTVTDRLIFCVSPVSCKTSDNRKYVHALAKAVAEQRGGSILELPHLEIDLLQLQPIGDRDYLKQMENLHKKLVSYLWLSYRFSGIFITRALATHVKLLVEERIEIALRLYSFINSAAIRAAREQKAKQRREQRAAKRAAQGKAASEPSGDMDEAERGEPYFEASLIAEDDTGSTTDPQGAEGQSAGKAGSIGLDAHLASEGGASEATPVVC